MSSAAFVVNDAIVKLLSAELPSGQMIVLRGILATALLAAGVVALGASRSLFVLMTPMMAMRLAAAAGATILFVSSLRSAPIATVNTVLHVTPLLVTAGATIFYGEKVGMHRWAAAAGGFLGVLLNVKPGSAELGTAAYVILVALAFTTVRDLATRSLERGITSIYVAAACAAVITLGGFLVAPFDTAWTMPTAAAWAWM